MLQEVYKLKCRPIFILIILSMLVKKSVTRDSPISLVMLLSLMTAAALGRFLQTSNLTTTAAPLVTAPKPLAVPFNASLQCGECILGGYLSCVNGPESYSGSVPIKTVCCQNSTVCPQLKNSSWSCSKKYENKTLVDKLRVCPFDSKQCGQQNLNLTDIQDGDCLRLNTLKKGTACLYRVQSMCAVPTLKTNDSNIYTTTLLVSNTSLTYQKGPSLTKQSNCTEERSQQCICKALPNSTANQSIQYSCDCDRIQNYTIDSAKCKQCVAYKDQLGNKIFQCSCPVLTSLQFYQDEVCSCVSTLDIVKNLTSLKCTGCGIATDEKPISLPYSQCKCVNASTSGNKLRCVCTDIAQCEDPEILNAKRESPSQPLKCPVAYPCNCSQGNNSLGCQCRNPSTGLNAQSSIDQSQCKCEYTFNVLNKTWSQSCQCCLSEDFVRTNLLPPAVCQAKSIKESCLCTNKTIGNSSTLTSINCSCQHPTSMLYASDLNFPSQGSCDCEDISMGTKSCKCCVPLDVQNQQQQPICQDNQLIQSCLCGAIDSIQKKATCQCTSAKTQFSYSNMTLNSTSCFCLDGTQSSPKKCNCCLADADFQKARPQCMGNKESAACKCSSVLNDSLSCNCTNKYFYNSTSENTLLPSSSCSCFGNSSTDCQCCLEKSDLIRGPQCSSQESQVSCIGCKYNSSQGIVSSCSCTGASVFDGLSPVYLNSQAFNTSACNCVQDGSKTSSCQCCAGFDRWQQATPTCSSLQTLEKCSCMNVANNITYNRTVSKQETVLTNVTCKRTGCNSEICSEEDELSVCTWNNSFSCYNQGRCEYQPASGKCGWTMTSSLNACLQKPLKPKSVTLTQQQTVANKTMTWTMVNKTRSVLYNETVTNTTFDWDCHCNNSRFPTVHIESPPLTRADCGGFNGSSYSCCIQKSFVDQLFYSRQVCSADQIASDCQCNYGKVNSSCSCTPLDSQISYKGLTLDTSKCACINQTSQQQGCRCCLESNFTTVLPQAPDTCNTAEASTSKCECEDFVNNLGKSNFKCSCVNETDSKYLTPSQCSCLNYQLGPLGKNQYSCNCCVPKAFQCPTSNLTLQDCSCSSFLGPKVKGQKTPQTNYNCSCERKDNAAIGQFTFASTHCQNNIADNSYQCCVSAVQIASQVPVLKCTSKQDEQQTCNCTSGLNETLSCSCIKPANNVTSSLFEASRNQCLAPAQTGFSDYQCCVPEIIQDSQIVRKACSAEAPIAQFCQCKNISGNTGGYNCTCYNSKFLQSKSFNFSNDQCVYYNRSLSECCLTSKDITELQPQLSCPAVGFTQASACSCSVISDKTRMLYNCSCPIDYQNSVYQVNDLSTLNNGCICNETTCGCCISDKQLFEVTEKKCLPNQYKSKCSSCFSTTPTSSSPNSTAFNCQDCSTETELYTILGQSFNKVTPDSCLCRENNNTNCTCCLSQRLSEPQAPATCSAQVLPSCACEEVNGTYACDCKSIKNNIMTEYRDIKIKNCSCLNVQRVNGTRPYQCQCCATADQISLSEPTCAQNSTAESCSCNNGKCDCSYQNKGVTLKDLSLDSSLCNCPQNNATFKACSCCVSPQLYKDWVTPTCKSTDSLATCSCYNVTTTVKKAKVINTFCDCTAKLQTQSGLVSNVNIPVNTEQSCGSFEEEGKTIYKCCLSERELTTVVPKVCNPAFQVNASCLCPASDGSSSRNCSCALRDGPTTTYVSSVKMSNSDCSCFNITSPEGVISQQCTCCASKTLTNFTLQVKAPTCNASLSSGSQNCDCLKVWDFTSNAYTHLCNCTSKSPRLDAIRQGVQIDPSECSCLNKTDDGNQNRLQCACCVPASPLTKCQSLRAASNSSILHCRCQDEVSNGKAIFGCNCSAEVNETSIVQRDRMVLKEENCCCVERSDFASGIGYKSCNCTQPALAVKQQCTCKPPSGKQNMMDCDCSDCNSVSSPKTLKVSSCQCPNMMADQRDGSQVKVGNETNQTVPAKSAKQNSARSGKLPKKDSQPSIGNSSVPSADIGSFSCSCLVDFSGLCPLVTPMQPLDENTCDQINAPKPAVITAPCNYQYESLVAVIATGKDSSLLLQLQDYQMQNANFILMSIVTLLVSSLSFIFF